MFTSRYRLRQCGIYQYRYQQYLDFLPGNAIFHQFMIDKELRYRQQTVLFQLRVKNIQNIYPIDRTLMDPNPGTTPAYVFLYCVQPACCQAPLFLCGYLLTQQARSYHPSPDPLHTSVSRLVAGGLYGLTVCGYLYLCLPSGEGLVLIRAAAVHQYLRTSLRLRQHVCHHTNTRDTEGGGEFRHDSALIKGINVVFENGTGL